MYKRARAPRNSLGSLLVTFLLGAVIGGAAVYGIVATPSTQPDPDVAPIEMATPADPDAPPVAPPAVAELAPEDPAADPPADAAPESVESIRGARYLFVSMPGSTLNADTRAFLGAFRPGGVVLLGHNIENRAQTIELVEAIKVAAGMGTGRADLPLIAVDQEGGTVNRLRLRQAPSAAEIGATEDTAYAAAVAGNYADACRARGIAICLAPVLDIRDPDGPAAFASRSFSEDNSVVSALGLAFAQGLMDGGVLAVAKHFPGHGATNADSHEAPAVLGHSIEQLAHIMYPFAEAVAFGIPGIMAGHITVTQLDAELPTTLSPRLLRQVLRGRWGYDGVILSDDLAMRAITDGHALEEAAVRALQAGCDALIITDADSDTLNRVAAAIEAAVEQGILDEALLRESERRLAHWQAWLRQSTDAITEPTGAETAIAEGDPPPPAPVEAGEPGKPEEAEEVEEVEEVEEQAPEGVEDEPEPAEVIVPEATEEEDPIEGTPVEPVAEQPQADPPDPTQGLVAIRHEVKQGEWLSHIATKYGVTTRQLVEWNDLRNDNVRYGTRLTVYLTPERAAAFNGQRVPVPETTVEPQDAIESESTTDDDSANDDQAPAANTRVIEHDVLPGETLTGVAQRYRVPTTAIVEWNKLDNMYLRVGQVLTIHVAQDWKDGE